MCEKPSCQFEYNGMKTAGVKITQTRHPLSISVRIKCLSSTPLKNKKILIKCSQIGGAHLQCVNNHYAKFEYKGIKTFGVTDYTNQTPSKHF